MAGKSATFENDLLKLVFNATALTGIAQNHSSPNANVFVSLHTADPLVTNDGAAATQNTSEIAYTTYARVSVARTTGGWTVSTDGAGVTSMVPVSAITFPIMTAGAGGTVTHFAVGELTSGAGKIFYAGTVTPNIVVSNGVTPQLTTASTITED